MAVTGKILKYSSYNGRGTYLDLDSLEEVPFRYTQFFDGKALPIKTKIKIINNIIYKDTLPWWKKLLGGNK